MRQVGRCARHAARAAWIIALVSGLTASGCSSASSEGPDAAPQPNSTAAVTDPAVGSSAEPAVVASASATSAPDDVPPPLPNTGELLSPTEIKKVVRASFDKMKICFEEGLARDPSLRGRVDVMLAIDDQGGVVSASAKPPTKKPKPGDMPALQDPQVRDCIVTHFQRLRFPHTNRGMMNFVYPVEFSVE